MKPSVLILAAHYLPGYRAGGPIRSIASLIAHLGDDFEFRVVTSNHDLDAAGPFPGIVTNSWTRVGKASVLYLSREKRSLRGIALVLRETSHDVLYLNSFFDTTFTLLPLVARSTGLAPRKPVVIAPRGEFSRGAYSLKWWKKRPYVQLMKWSGLLRDVTWQASTALEASDIQRVMQVPVGRLHEARNLACPPDRSSTVPRARQTHKTAAEVGRSQLRVCWVARVSPMKNLDFALRILSRVKLPVRFNIYGPKESPAYWEECQKLIARLPEHIEVRDFGAVEPSDVVEVIAQHDVFFVPTRGENFGHVFLEAWSAGVPVLISDQTPWRELESRGLGWDLPLHDPQSFADALESLATLSEDERVEIGRRCLEFAESMFQDAAAVESNRSLLRDKAWESRSTRQGIR